MNIFELTRILNEATQIANEISNDILNYDEQIETSNPTDTKAKAKKTNFFKKIKHIIEDEVDENSIRNQMINVLKSNGFISGKKTLQATIATIQHILHNQSNKVLEFFRDKIGNEKGDVKLQAQGSVFSDLGDGSVTNFIYQIKNFRPYGCGPWEAFFGLFYGAKNHKTKGDIIIGDCVYEVKLSNSGYIDNKNVNSEFNKRFPNQFDNEGLLKLGIYLEQGKRMIVIDGMGNYVIVHHGNFESLVRDGVISINRKTKGTNTDFGELVICYNAKH